MSRACEIAWFWRLDPFAVMAMREEDLQLLEREGRRIARKLHPDG